MPAENSALLHRGCRAIWVRSAKIMSRLDYIPSKWRGYALKVLSFFWLGSCLPQQAAGNSACPRS